jgi:hypothetical protein
MNFKLATLAAAMLASAPALADFTNMPDPYAAGFGFDTPTEASWGGWARGDAGTVYAEFDTFTDITYGAINDRTAAPDSGSFGATDAHIAWNSGTFKAGSGNLYSFSVDESFAINLSGSVPAGPVRAVLQVEVWGNDLTSVTLNGVAATYAATTFTDPAFQSSFGEVDLRQAVFYWDLAVAPTSYTFAIEASVHTAFAQAAVDIAAAPVPEPETYAMLIAGLGLVGWQTRRRNPAAQAVAA